MDLTRRTFLAGAGATAGASRPEDRLRGDHTAPELPPLTAQWIWYPERRTLPSTFVHFRRVYELGAKPEGPVHAWVTGQSRYQLFVNGMLVSRGPAPGDPRYWDIDPVDLAPHLTAGANVIAAIVCMYGGGEGTWIPPSPLGSGGYGQGFLFEAPSLGWRTDSSWLTHRSRAWKSGNYQRWYLRALQEEFDMRHWPEGWLEPGFVTKSWKQARPAATKPGRPNLTETPRGGPDPRWTLQPRAIPAVKERRVRASRAVNAGWIEWRVSPEEYFECFPDDAFAERVDASVLSGSGFPYRIAASGNGSAAVTFEFERQHTGHPYVVVDAPEGAVIEILFLERQEPGKLLLRIPPRFGQWIRLITREGENRFDSFEYEAVKQMQLLIRNASRPVEIREAGVIARRYDWPHECDLEISDPLVRRTCEASLNTHDLTAIETVVDNQVRERQQYSGDLEHPKLASYYAHGEYRQAARMFRTYTQGQNREGWFLDCYPAWDRCQRLYQKHLGLTEWGPIIDHSLQFGIALAEHYLFTGDEELIREITPRLRRFDEFLRRNLGRDGLLPVEPWTWNSVWIDHIGYRVEQDKHAALNLYYAGFLRAGMARLLAWTGDARGSNDAEALASTLIARVRQRYWSPSRRLYVDNLPRAAADREIRVHARTLSMALLFGAVEPEHWEPALRLLESMTTKSNPDVHVFEDGGLTLGANYPLNDIWRMWALARGGRGAAVVRDLRERWADLPSVLENGTYAEFWNPQPSSSGQVWCQSNPVPVICAYQVLLGVRPTQPGFRAYEVRPQPGEVASVRATIHTVAGDIPIRVGGRGRGFTAEWSSPPGLIPTLVTPSEARMTGLPANVRVSPGRHPGTAEVRLPPGSGREWRIDVDW